MQSQATYGPSVDKGRRRGAGSGPRVWDEEDCGVSVRGSMGEAVGKRSGRPPQVWRERRGRLAQDLPPARQVPGHSAAVSLAPLSEVG